MKPIPVLMPRFRAAVAVAALVFSIMSVAAPTAQSVSVSAGETTLRIRRALERLPYYGVFDFLAYTSERGTVTLLGYAYQGNLKNSATSAVKRVAGVDEVADKIEQLPASLNDDRIRWATFYSIYTDDFLSRYAPGGPMAARYDLLQFRRFPGTQPFGTYPIHIIVRGGRTTLLGVVDSESDKTLAGVRAREVSQVFSVDNDLIVSKN
jgi:hyperosmotically inducible periplasmic protein